MSSSLTVRPDMIQQSMAIMTLSRPALGRSGVLCAPGVQAPHSGSRVSELPPAAFASLRCAIMGEEGLCLFLSPPVILKTPDIWSALLVRYRSFVPAPSASTEVARSPGQVVQSTQSEQGRSRTQLYPIMCFLEREILYSCRQVFGQATQNSK